MWCHWRLPWWLKCPPSWAQVMDCCFASKFAPLVSLLNKQSSFLSQVARPRAESRGTGLIAALWCLTQDCAPVTSGADSPLDPLDTPRSSHFLDLSWKSSLIFLLLWLPDSFFTFLQMVTPLTHLWCSFVINWENIISTFSRIGSVWITRLPVNVHCSIMNHSKVIFRK